VRNKKAVPASLDALHKANKSLNLCVKRGDWYRACNPAAFMFSKATSEEPALVVTQRDVHSPHLLSRLCQDVAQLADEDHGSTIIELDCRSSAEAELEDWWRTATTLIRCLVRGSSGGRLVLRHASNDSRDCGLAALATELAEAWRDCRVEVVAMPADAGNSPAVDEQTQDRLQSSPFSTLSTPASSAA
jgi:hypothetical protein